VGYSAIVNRGGFNFWLTMKLFITPSYTFTPGASGVGTVNLSGIAGFDIKYLVAVINQTRGVVIYSTADVGARFTNVVGTTITLNYDTSSHNSGDVLQVIYEVTAANPLTDAQLRASAVPVSGTVTANTGLVQPLTDAQLRAAAVPVSGTFFQATQPVSIAAPVAVTGPLTDTQLRATPVPVSGTVTANTGLSQPLTDAQLRAAAVPISAASLPLATGAATSANQSTSNTLLTNIDGKLGSLGQKTMANSAPVTIASDQSAIPITGSITATNPSVGTTGSAVPASGTLVAGTDGTNLRGIKTDASGELQIDVLSSALPSGAATAANQTTANSSLSSIDSKLNTLGQKTMANSTPVTIASDQGSILTTNSSLGLVGFPAIAGAAQIGGTDGTTMRAIKTDAAGELQVDVLTAPLPVGAATSSNQTTTNTLLTNIDGKLGSLGQKTMANSAPVVIASDQSAIPITGSITATNPSVMPDYSAFISGTTEVTLIAGQDLAQVQALKCDGNGELYVRGPMTLTDFQSTFVSGGLPISGSITASNPSVSSTGSAVPADATLIGGTDGTNLRGIKTDASGELQVDVLSSALPAGAATSANQAPLTTTHPFPNASGAVVRQAPSEIWSVGFAAVGSSLLAPELTQRRQGTGVGVSQSASNLVLTSGTTANSEYLARSVQSFRGALTARHKTILSQRIANNNFAVMLADKVGEGLSCTINSATSITVTLTAHGFTSENVGQSMMVGAINGANGVPGRYAIASIPSVDTINFTVAGWPASGSCTVDLFGWNYLWTQYTGTTATNAGVDAQRRGWNSGNTTATINTTASPGHVMQTYADGRNVNWADSLVASSTTPTVTTRASRIENIPDDDTELYFYLWLWNGTTNPASTTTWTIGFLSVEDNANVPTYIAGVRPNGAQAALSVGVVGTVTTSFTQPALVAGTAAIGDVGVQYRANATGAASSSSVMSGATVVVTTIKASAGRLIGWYLQNSAAAVRSVKVFNVVAGSVTLGTTAALFEIDIPAGGTAQLHFEGGIAFSTAMTFAVTSAKGLTDNTPTGLAVNDVSGFFAFA
jgi:hypothetical protein